jgi:hypothetical protein
MSESTNQPTRSGPSVPPPRPVHQASQPRIAPTTLGRDLAPYSAAEAPGTNRSRKRPTSRVLSGAWYQRTSSPQIKCHTAQSLFARNSLKIKGSCPNKVSHFLNPENRTSQLSPQPLDRAETRFSTSVPILRPRIGALALLVHFGLPPILSLQEQAFCSKEFCFGPQRTSCIAPLSDALAAYGPLDRRKCRG